MSPFLVWHCSMQVLPLLDEVDTSLSDGYWATYGFAARRASPGHCSRLLVVSLKQMI
ncbi:hypothetical protein DPMN_040376 [Dreissena polymorpha]|uniref:Uncharacterized protein n=1 Tax=Dreissena polymorpha TaxID=45954 RepID=A0A9D4CV61_DREPO|nr:hypothetical protein DPMN_040376 [Dreissena polymorpha]